VGAELTRVETATEMREATLQLLPQSHLVIMAAAVGDYRAKHPSEQKIKRKGPMTLELEPNVDILADLARRKTGQVIVGFAAETENALENARKKLASKALDAIVVNDVSREGIGFDSERNAVTILTHADVIEVPEMSKRDVAERVLDAVTGLRASAVTSA
jgi:phosphopantothenoylcysteine decarboxylase/phosphopantothenate--cysteine ligase